MSKALFAPITQFVRPVHAHRYLVGEGRLQALVSSALLILLGGFAAGVQYSILSWEVPVFMLVERMLLAALGGAAVWGIARALGEKARLLPAMYSAFMSMTVWVLCVALLMWVQRPAGLPPGFTWSLGELAAWLPGSQAGAFVFIVLLNLDIPSIATVFIFGRGLSAVWGAGPSFGIRLAWAVYLFAVLLQAVPVVLSPEVGEVGTL